MLNAVLLSVHRCFAPLNMTVAWWTSGGGQWRAVRPGRERPKAAKAVKTSGSGLRRFCFGDLGMERVCMFRKVSLYLHSNAIMGRCDTAFGLH